MIVGGFAKDDDEHPGPQVYFIDHLASLARVPFATQGYGGMFTSSLLDKHYKPGMTYDEVKSLMKRCIEEAQKRLLVQMPNFKVRERIYCLQVRGTMIRLFVSPFKT